MSRYPGTRHAALDLDALKTALRVQSTSGLVDAMGGVDHRAVRRAATDGLTVDQAEAWAQRAGLHPAEIWHAWPDVILEEKRARRAAYQRDWKRERAGDGYKARQRAARRAYYAACGEYERARERARYRANDGAARKRAQRQRRAA